jgi:hypothetical protein
MRGRPGRRHNLPVVSSGDNRVKIKSQKDFVSGLMFSIIGAAFAFGATKYSLGTGARMGPGYFPLLLGVLLCIVGVVVAFKALVVETADGEPIGKIAWKPLGFIIGANVLFGILLGGLPGLKIPAMGLIVAIYGLVLVASLAGDRFKLREVLVLATVLAVGSYGAFVMLLKLQFPVWPTFITN